MKKSSGSDSKQRSISAFFAPRPGAQAPSATKSTAAKKPAPAPSAAQENACPTPNPKPLTPPAAAEPAAAAGPGQAPGASPAAPEPTPASARQPLTPSDANRPIASPATAAAPAAAGAAQQDGAAGGGASRGAGTPSGDPPVGAALVGWSLEVYWPLDAAWYQGRLIEWDGQQYRVEYEDGDEEWLTLEAQRYRLKGPPPAGAAGQGGRPAKRRRAVVESSDDEEAEGAGDDELDSDYGGDEAAAAVQASSEEEDLEEVDEDEEEEEEEAVGRKGSAKRHKTELGPAGSSRPAGRGRAPSSAGRTPMDRPPAAAATRPTSSAAPTPTPRRGGPPPSPVGFQGLTPQRPTQEEGEEEGDVGGTPEVTPEQVLGSLAGRAGPRTKARLSGALDCTPGSSSGASGGFGAGRGAGTAGGTLPQVVLGVKAHGGAEAARFAARMAERFPFLRADRIKDAAGRRPDHPSYNPSTLYIPPGWYKEHKITEAQQQWWELKAANFDSVLLFKVGKFYEMFEMDSYVAVDVLGLSYMKGDQPHAGFPEASYAAMGEQLARAGYRVLVVEQTETPEQLAERNRSRRAAGQKAASVVRREAVAVLSAGTLTDPAMVVAQPDAAWVLAVVERPGSVAGEAGEGADPDAPPPAPVLGVCALDAAGGQLLLGAWQDDEVRLGLRQVLAALCPAELVLPRPGPPASLVSVLKGGAPGAVVRQLAGVEGAGDPAAAAQAIRSCRHFPDATPPPLLQQLLAAHEAGSDPTSTAGAGAGDSGPAPMELDASGAAGCGAGGSDGGSSVAPSCCWGDPAAVDAALCAHALMLGFLGSNLLEEVVLPGAAYTQLLQQGSPAAGADPTAAPGGEVAPGGGPRYMALDGAALENLEVLANSAGGVAGSLAGLLDHSTTPFGRRRLRAWLVRPLARVADITARQDAVEELMGPLAEAAGGARRALAGCSDLERVLARLAASARCEGGGVGREAPHVVLYEDVGKRRVAQLVGAVRDLGALEAALGALAEAGPSSALLAGLVDRGRWSKLSAALAELREATDWGEAAASGTITPRRGGDPDHDAAEEALTAAEAALKSYLGEVRRELRCNSISYISCNQDSHLLEVPDSVKVPSEYSLSNQRKGFRRYTTPELGELVADYAAAQQQLEEARGGLLLALVRRFMSHRPVWSAAVEAVAQLDALVALAGAGLAAEGSMCRPLVVEPQPGAGPFFHAIQLRHPAGLSGSSGCFVPNDITLGAPPAELVQQAGGEADGAAPRFLVLTGPNMGGKSTLLRQVCLAAILAQVGAWVPATSLTLSAMDGVYVRMGARDAILSGQSTFYVELAETGALLRRATPRSLVVLDELGRGTATLDGAAIAGAVLDTLAHQVGCCGLLATHYHQLAAGHAADPQVALMHMGCAVNDSSAGGGDSSSGGVVGVGPGGAPCTPGGASSSGGAARGASSGVEVTFLYKLTPGACPKSYGTNVARLAGLPPSVVARAATISQEREVGGAAAGAPGGGGEGSAPQQQVLQALQQLLSQLKPLKQAAGQQGDSAGEQQGDGPATPAKVALEALPWQQLQQQAQQALALAAAGSS